MAVLAIDQGTSATKAMVVGDDGGVLRFAEVSVNPRYLGDGKVEQDPEELWDSVVAAGRQALEGSPEPVTAVGFANQGETVLAWDPSDGAVRSTALSWQDRRGQVICRELAEHAERLTEVTGLPLDPYFAAPKMTWLAREVDAPDAAITTSDAWLLWRMTGAFVTDAATASRTMLLDLRDVGWSSEALEVFGVADRPQPRVVDCAEPVGTTSAFGTAEPLPVTGLAVDQQAALFAERCFEPGEMKVTYGTGAFLLANLGPLPAISHTGLVTCVAWRVGDRLDYCLDGQVYSVGSTISWLERLGIIDEPADLDRLAQPDGTGEGSAETFVPALAGLAAPYWRDDARGALTGLSLSTGKAEVVTAVLRSIAASVARLAGAVREDTAIAPATLRADGGLTRSRALMQMQADLAQVPVEVYPSPHATTLGVGALARLGAGHVETLEAAVPAWTPSAVYEPTISGRQAAAVLDRFDEVVERVALT